MADSATVIPDYVPDDITTRPFLEPRPEAVVLVHDHDPLSASLRERIHEDEAGAHYAPAILLVFVLASLAIIVGALWSLIAKVIA